MVVVLMLSFFVHGYTIVTCFCLMKLQVNLLLRTKKTIAFSRYSFRIENIQFIIKAKISTGT